MIFNIMDVNNNGEIVARIESNNGKNALKQFQRRCCFSTGFYEIKKSRFNGCMFSTYGGAWYAAPQKGE